MLRATCKQFGRLLAVSALMALAAGVALAAGSTVPADEPGVARAAWLLQRGSLETLALTGLPAQPDEFGGGGGAVDPTATDFDEERHGGVVPVLASLVLPGAGEALLGHKRGYFMMALDIFAWTKVASNHKDGNDLRDEYYAFADAHYSDGRLTRAYLASTPDIERNGMGSLYFPDIGTIADSTGLDALPLYVTKEEDRREYYENLGKWDQFVFGWDDFLSPQSYAQLPGNEDYTPTENSKIDFANPWVSENREAYRLLRDASNDAFKTRDRWLTLNLGLRVFSVLQTAWLDGLLGGGGGGDGGGDGENRLSVAGHDVRLIAQPTGLRRATVAAAITF